MFRLFDVCFFVRWGYIEKKKFKKSIIHKLAQGQISAILEFLIGAKINHPNGSFPYESIPCTLQTSIIENNSIIQTVTTMISIQSYEIQSYEIQSYNRHHLQKVSSRMSMIKDIQETQPRHIPMTSNTCMQNSHAN